jgi:phospholipid/cholesterol/gamma-HCH transport system substrate-binding protein
MSRHGRSTRRRTTRIAALAASGALLLSGCDFSVYDLPLPGGADLGDNPYKVTVEFRDVLDLVPQSTVKVDDVSVGIVDDVKLDGYTADVTLLLNHDVDLPGNAIATIRQTSLLGEKFVSLAPPPSDPSSDKLGDGDVIPLARSGRNIEVEEVLGALSLVLNGGGVGQLKTITTELNKVFSGREDDIRSVLDQIKTFMTTLDGSKDQIVRALEQVNSLSVSLNKQTDTLDLALKELPSAIASVDRQRDDIVKMLSALSRLSSVGTKVIDASAQNTVTSLNSLAPVLTAFAKTGDDFVNSLQIFLTYPFIDGVVGKNAQQARDLHMGDYTNLSIQLEVDLSNGLPGIGNPQGGPGTPGIPLPTLPVPTPTLPVPTISANPQLPGGGGGGSGGPLPTKLPGLGRAAVGDRSHGARSHDRGGAVVHGVDTDLAAMLLWGVMDQ